MKDGAARRWRLLPKLLPPPQQQTVQTYLPSLCRVENPLDHPVPMSFFNVQDSFIATRFLALKATMSAIY
jgi:hypothetical protein